MTQSRSEQVGLPDHAGLRRELLGVIAANLALDAKLKSQNRVAELGDLSARRQAFIETVRGITRRYGAEASPDAAGALIALVQQYLLAFLGAVKETVGDVMDLQSKLNTGQLEDILTEFTRAPVEVQMLEKLNKQLPSDIQQLTVDDMKIIEAGVAQADREAAKPLPSATKSGCGAQVIALMVSLVVGLLAILV